MERLTARIVKEYQEKKNHSRTASEFKKIGLELCNRCGLTDMEAIHILNGKNIVDIMIKYEKDDCIDKIMDDLDTKIKKERHILNETGIEEKDRMVRSTAAAYVIAYYNCKSLIKKHFRNSERTIL